MQLKKHIPNVLTLGNLSCGALAIILTFEGDILLACIFAGIGLLFDFLDGFVARLLKVSSPLGKELDSMADMVTFGVLPAIIMYHLMMSSTCVTGTCTGIIPKYHLPYTAILLAASAGLRLAKFNIDTRQSETFIGLPTPAMAMVVISLPVIQSFDQLPSDLILQPKALLLLTIFLAYLMNAEIELIALKFKSTSFFDNIWKWILIAGCILFLLIFQWIGIPACILFYVAISAVKNSFFKEKTNHKQ